jgi:mRNA-degrading endonuclease toxin of MazEF toxin-antitoxin module
LKTRLGFAPRGEEDSVVVVQADGLNAVLPSLVVVPLDSAVQLYASHPAAVLVPAREAGSRVDHVAVVPQVGVVLADRFSGGAVGRLSAQTLSKLDRVLRLVLEL